MNVASAPPAAAEPPAAASPGPGPGPGPTAATAATATHGLPARLSLTPVERFMLDDDRPSHPMTGIHELVVRGRLDDDLLAGALEAARRRHPLLCRIVDDSGREPVWVPAPADMTVAVDRAPAGTPRTHPLGHWLDVRREIGLRVWVRDEEPDADGTPVCRLSAAVHHSVADALGGITFLLDLFAHLSAALGGVPVPAPPDPERVLHRGQLYEPSGLLPGLPKGRLGVWGHLLIGARRMKRTKTLPLAPGSRGKPVSAKPPPGADAEAAGVPPVDAVSPPRTVSFTEAETHGLRAAAKARGMTLNDLLLRDVFLTVREHNARYDNAGATLDGSPAAVRINVPVNLRDEADLPAALRRSQSRGVRGGGLTVVNKIGMALVTRPTALADDPEALLRSVHEEMSWVRQTERGRRFVEAVLLSYRLLKRPPGGMFDGTCYATAVLSNIGDLSRVIPPELRDERGRLHAPAADPADALTVTEYATGSPGRALTRATVLAASYGGRLQLHLRTDPEEIAPEDAAAFSADLAARVRRSAAG
ncbi:hypothetical protein [Alienimonas californiensis]|uniref:Acyltransferase PapA5 n=1 Tax=Alienimonas californiensis TaxID=2527989 RepID=A0A517PFK2_9PLAN|nr:hypothetical protein [Alienimonas californiensis]QDT18145.1 acyltransferase PapA5 [Alienimonas californiensis]